MKVFLLRPSLLWVATALSFIVALVAVTIAHATTYGLPSLFYVPLVFASMAGGRRAAIVAALALTIVFVAVMIITATAGAAEIATVGVIRLAVSLLIGLPIGASVDYNRQLVDSAVGRANQDFLTGLGTRYALNERWARRPHPEKSFGVVAIDMDGLKRINDQAGHAAGDAALKLLAASIRLGSGSHDLLARLGGDEFVVVADVDGRAQLESLASRIALHANQNSVEASIGIAISPDDGEDLADVIRVADHRMYAHKLSKREHEQAVA